MFMYESFVMLLVGAMAIPVLGLMVLALASPLVAPRRAVR
jgi:hypothetical protein